MLEGRRGPHLVAAAAEEHLRPGPSRRGGACRPVLLAPAAPSASAAIACTPTGGDAAGRDLSCLRIVRQAAMHEHRVGEIP
jgi:hypothetical protein